jgi:hypothetical protein
MMMTPAKVKRMIAASGFAVALAAAAPGTLAQALPPPLPQLTTQQSADLERRVDAYRKDTDARVARGEITADEADRLVKWREWQIAQRIARSAPASAPRRAYASPPPDYDASRPPDYDASRPPDYDASRPPDYYDSRPPDYDESRPDYVIVEPPVYYGPYYRYAAPSYWGPRPYYYWGPSVCAGGFGRHFGGRICF